MAEAGLRSVSAKLPLPVSGLTAYGRVSALARAIGRLGRMIIAVGVEIMEYMRGRRRMFNTAWINGRRKHGTNVDSGYNARRMAAIGRRSGER